MDTSAAANLSTFAAAFAQESSVQAAIGVLWRILLLGIVLNALFCHISPGLMVRLQSNPWTTQFNWLFGVQAQNFQTLNFVLYHQSFMGKVSHIPTISAEFFAWAYIVFFTLGSVSCFLLLALVMVQAASTRFLPLVVATGIATLTTFAACEYLSEMPATSQLFIHRCMQLIVLIGGPVRVYGHYFEEKLPPMPSERRESTLFRFKSEEEVPVDTKLILVVAPQAILAEASAGMPLRLFVPMLNLFIGQFFETTDETRPEGLESVQALCKTSKNILSKGWTMTRPSKAALIRSAVQLETAPTTPQDTLLAPKWYWFFMTECLGLLLVCIGWLLRPNMFLMQYGWVPYSTDDPFCCGLGPDGDAVTPSAFALSIAASVVICGFVWVMLRMLAAKNLDIRAFCYVVEGLTVCGMLLFIFLIALQMNGLAVTVGSETKTKRADFVTTFITTTHFMAFSAIHFFFLHVEVPQMRARQALMSDSSVLAKSSVSRQGEQLQSSSSTFNLLRGRSPMLSTSHFRSGSVAEIEDDENEDDVFALTFRRSSSRLFNRLSHCYPSSPFPDRRLSKAVPEEDENEESSAKMRPSTGNEANFGTEAKKRCVRFIEEDMEEETGEQ